MITVFGGSTDDSLSVSRTVRKSKTMSWKKLQHDKNWTEVFVIALWVHHHKFTFQITHRRLLSQWYQKYLISAALKLLQSQGWKYFHFSYCASWFKGIFWDIVRNTLIHFLAESWTGRLKQLAYLNNNMPLQLGTRGGGHVAWLCPKLPRSI